MSDWSGQLSILLHVLLAMGLGGVIGAEREMADKPAGLRTHMLVTGAATLLVSLGNAIIVQTDAMATSNITSDPLRLLEAIIAGISFLGAGTIFRRDHSSSIEGLTTAASILFAAAVGISVAIQHYILAIGATGLVVLVTRGGAYLAQAFPNNKSK